MQDLEIDMFGDGDPVRYIPSCSVRPKVKSYFTVQPRSTCGDIDKHYYGAGHAHNNSNWSPFDSWDGKDSPEVSSHFSLHSGVGKGALVRTMHRADALEKMSTFETVRGQPGHLSEVADHRMRDLAIKTSRARGPRTSGIMSNFDSGPGQYTVQKTMGANVPGPSVRRSHVSTRPEGLRRTELSHVGIGLGSIRRDPRFDLPSCQSLRDGEGNVTSNAHSGGDLHSLTSSRFPYANFKTTYVRGRDHGGPDGEPEALITG